MASSVDSMFSDKNIFSRFKGIHIIIFSKSMILLKELKIGLGNLEVYVEGEILGLFGIIDSCLIDLFLLPSLTTHKTRKVFIF
jgi:hypothetical protein